MLMKNLFNYNFNSFSKHKTLMAAGSDSSSGEVLQMRSLYTTMQLN